MPGEKERGCEQGSVAEIMRFLFATKAKVKCLDIYVKLFFGTVFMAQGAFQDSLS